MRAAQLHKPLLFILATLLVGCSGMVQRDTVTPTTDEVVASPLPGQEGQQPLTPDLIFNVLAGEIALQRGQLDLAYDRQLDTATLASDAASAERATRIAIHQRDYPRASKALNRWVEFSPDDLSAHTMAVVIAMHVGDESLALKHLKRAVILVEEKDEDGLLHAAAALSQAKREALALKLMQRLVLDYPDDPRGSYALALIAVLAKEYPLAESEVRRVLQQRPKMVKAHVLLSRILITTGEMDGGAHGFAGCSETIYPRDCATYRICPSVA